MKNSKDRLLKILIVIATLIILGTLAVLAFLNFSGSQAKNDRGLNTTTVRVMTSSTNSTSSTSTTEDADDSSSSSTKTSTTSRSSQREAERSQTQPREEVKTQGNLSLEEAIKENANEGRGERATTSGSQGFDSQAEAHAYGLKEINRIVNEEHKSASYVVKAVRDSDGKVVSWEAEITVE